MPLSKIKKEFEGSAHIAFGKETGKLGERPDIDELAVIAHESGDKSLLNLFETLPSLEELKNAKTDGQLKAAPVAKPAVPSVAEIAK